MNTVNAQSYSSKSTALRGAKRAGFDALQIGVFSSEGRWYWEPVEAEPKAKKAKKNVYTAKAKKVEEAETKAKSYKEIWNNNRSAITKPVDFIRDFLNLHGEDLTRKQAVTALVEKGINYSTARTQYQRWFASK